MIILDRSTNRARNPHAVAFGARERNRMRKRWFDVVVHPLDAAAEAAGR